MTSVLQLVHRLESRPTLCEPLGVQLRNYIGDRDINTWLEIRDQAFARERLGVRRWSSSDFQSEFLDKSWWNPGRMWFAEAETSSGRVAVGTVTMAVRGDHFEGLPVVHWLAVVPRWRRKGIARLLVATLEAECWDQGHREVWLETHAQWRAAAKFYEAMGYVRH